MADEAQMTDALCPSWATGVGYMGVAAAVVLSNWGSAVRHTCHCARDRIAFGFLAPVVAAPKIYTNIILLNYGKFRTYLCYIYIPC